MICCLSPAAKFVVPEWGKIVDSGIGVSCRPGCRTGLPAICTVTWREPFAGINFIPTVRDYDLDTEFILLALVLNTWY